MRTGFYTGRFQPFHLGHLSAIKQALREVNFLVIGIGSAQYSDTKDNPFTAEERTAYIRDALLENGVNEDRFKIIPITDIHSNPEWPGHVQSLVPPFSLVFVGEDNLVKELFEEYTDIPVKMVKKEVDICATDIRKAMLNGDEWKKYLSKSTMGHMEKMDAANRLKTIKI